MMKMKPKSTVHNTPALVYKRFIGLERSLNLQTVYKTLYDNLFWTFDNLTLTFSKIESSQIPATSSVIQIQTLTTILQYQDKYYRYATTGWEQVTELASQGITLLSATFNNIAKYQMNKYYYVGSFDFMIKGSIEGTTSQYIKGNIIPLSSMNIKYFCDDIDLSVDDLVVVNGRLYSVENPETTIKQQPKPYKVYFATLNSVL